MKLTREILDRLPFPVRVEIEENSSRLDLSQSELAAVQKRVAKILTKHQPKGAPKGNRNATKNKGTKSGPVKSESERKAEQTDALVGQLFGLRRRGATGRVTFHIGGFYSGNGRDNA